MRRKPFEIGGRQIPPGSRQTVDLPVSVLSDHTPVTMSVHVVHGREPGPTLFVSAAIHGDEVMGVEIVRRLLRMPSLDTLKGTLLAIPIVNSYASSIIHATCRTGGTSTAPSPATRSGPWPRVSPTCS